MATQHYHLIIVGDAPAGRLAGILLGRKGSRVLHLTGFGWPTYLLWQNSQLLEKLLDNLQARSCLTTPLPIQFHQQNLCCEIHGATPFSDEVRRELPDCYRQILDLLEQLSEWGSLLQKSLYQLGTSPATGWRAGLTWQLTTIRNGIRATCRKQTLARWLSSQDISARAQTFINGLISSCSLDLAERLSLTEAALIWSQLSNRHMIAPAALDSLLGQRLTDTGADTKPAFNLSAVAPGTNQTLACTLGKQQVTCDALVIAGQPGWVIDGWPSGPQDSARPAVWHLDQFAGAASRLLAPRLLVDSEAGSFQVGIGQRDGDSDIYVRTGLDLSETTELTAEIARLFPFASFLPMLKETGTPGGKRLGPCGEQTPFQPVKNIFLGAGAIYSPTLGPLGEVITAMSLVNQLKKSE